MRDVVHFPRTLAEPAMVARDAAEYKQCDGSAIVVAANRESA
jgi:hypothetical protein